MYLFTISVLLISNLFIAATSYEAISSRSFQTSDVNQCACFPGGQSLIPELSNPEANDLERLVVYLYRNSKTNQVHVFKPSPEKQSLIPNIPYVQNDLLKPVTTETIVSLFDNNHISAPSQYPFSTQGDPIGLNIGIIDNKGDIANPNWDFKGAISSDASMYIPDHGHLVPSKLSHLDWYPSKKQLVHSQNKPNQQQHFNIPNLQLQASLAQVADNYVEKDIWSLQEEKHNTLLNPYQNQPTVQPAKSDLVDELISNRDVYETEENLHKSPSKFDVWFKEQIETFQDTKLSESVKVTDTDALRSLVLKNLLENGIHIGPTGMMIDGNGIPIDLNNLELRPILVGSPVKFQALELTQQLRFPDTLPYLEGILIILIDPFKILGVIPLGKTYVANPGKAIQDRPFRASQVTSPSITSYTHSNLNGPSSNFRSFSQIPFYAGLTEKLALKSLDTSSTLTKPKQMLNPLTYAYEEPFTSHLEFNSVSQPYNINRRQTDTNNWNSLSNMNSNYQYPNGQNPHLLISQIKNNLGAYSTSGNNPQLIVSPSSTLYSIDSQIQKYWNLTPGSTRKQISGISTSPDQTTQRHSDQSNLHVIVIPLDGKRETEFESNSNTANAILNPIISHDGPTPNNIWELYSSKMDSTLLNEKNNPNLYVKPKNSFVSPTSGYYPGFNSNHYIVGPDSKEVADSSSWNSLSNSEWGFNNGPNNPQNYPQQQSTWGSGWEKNVLKSVPSVLDSETSGIQIANWNNFDGGLNQPLSMGSTRRVSTPLLKGVLKTLFKAVIDNFVGKYQDGGQGRRKNDEASELKVNETIGNPVKKSEVIDEGDRPDFRIIGGSAATGSGSPLSNKGRSGLSII